MKNIYSIVLFFISQTSFAQSWVWGANGTSPLTTTCRASGYSMCEDRKHNTYIFGGLLDTLYFGTDILVAQPNNASLFIAKYDANGNYKWSREEKPIRNGSFDLLSTCADPFGNILLTGYHTDTVMFAGDSLFGTLSYASIFVVKYDSIGNLMWAFQPKGNGGQSRSVTTDNKGNIYCAGFFFGTEIFGKDTMTAKTSPGTPFLLKLDANGNVIWVKKVRYKGKQNFTTYCSATDQTGNTYVSGFITQDTVYFAKDTLYSRSQFFLLKYDSAGNEIWAAEAYSPNANNNNAASYAMTIDGDGNAVVSGFLAGSVTFDTIKVYDTIGKNIRRVYLASYTPAGHVKWVTQSISQINGNTEPYGLSSDASSNLYLVGRGNNLSYPYWIEFGTDSMYFNGASAGTFIEKFNGNGIPQCGSKVTYGQSVAVASDSTGNFVYCTSSLYDTIKFGPSTLGNPLLKTSWPFVARWKPCNDIITDVNKIENISNIEVFPNPSAGHFTILLPVLKSKSSVEIYDMLGENIYSVVLPGTSEASVIEININNQPNGVYLYRLLSVKDELIGSGKLIIQK